MTSLMTWLSDDQGQVLDQGNKTSLQNSTSKSTYPGTTTGNTNIPSDSPMSNTIAASTTPGGVCQASPCLNGGVCRPQGGSSFSCECADFYSGALCDQGGPCTVKPCLNGGICVNNGNSNRCICPNTFNGPNCENNMADNSTDSGNTTTTTPSTPTSGINSTQCDNMLKKADIGCGDADIVFLIEHSAIDTGSAIDHQGDTVLELFDLWADQNRNIRIGVVAYNDDADKILDLSDVNNHKSHSKNTIKSYTDTLHRPHRHDLHASGEANLAKAFDFAREQMFDDSRPGVAKVVIPIVHQIPTYARARQTIVASGQDLIAGCVSIVALTVQNHGELHDDTVQQTVQQAAGSSDDFINKVSSYQYLEDLADDKRLFNCRRH